MPRMTSTRSAIGSRVLVIEDDEAILRGLVDNLRFEGYSVLTAADGQRGLELIRAERPDLVVLDLMLPLMSGLEVARRVRKAGLSVPLLMLTARGEEMDRVMGFEWGADDYVTKPFSISELLARIRAVLRRAQPSHLLPHALQFEDVEIDFASYAARKRGKPLQLTPKEFGLLRVLASRPGQVFTRDQLLTDVWGYDRYPTTRTVDNHIASLRLKLEKNPDQPCHLITVHGVGYKLVIEPN
jgi:DNA-binding response OmpR family regulator